LSSKDNQHDARLDKIFNIFKNANATGTQGEMILEHTLTNAGFIAGVDFELQYQTIDGKYKPDAVVFLTNDDIMVIDSKSSQSFMPESDITEDNKNKKIKDSMITHINDLSKKDYKNAVVESLKKTHKKQVRNVHLFMFLASEIFIEMAIKAFSGFYGECLKNNIYPCGPITLSYAIDIAKISKTQYHADKNLKDILVEIDKLIKHSKVLFERAGGIIKEYGQMNEAIEKFQITRDKFHKQAQEVEKRKSSSLIDFNQSQTLDDESDKGDESFDLL
jgi:DNA recombination protein RmuC